MTGTTSQIEWAEQIKPRVNAEFDRVAQAFRGAGGSHTSEDQAAIEQIIAILEEKRRDVLANDQAGYFIRDWRELTDQVRRMIGDDPRFRVIKAERAERARLAV